MAVQNDTSRIQYNGNNSTVNAYAIPFPFFENAHIRCVITTSAGVDSELTLGSGFTLTGAGNPSGGSLLTVVAVPNTSKVTIFRNVPATQTTSYQEGGDFPAASHERALDKLTMLTQQLGRSVARSLKVPESQNSPNDLPNAAAGKRLLASDNGVISWAEDRQIPAYPQAAGQKLLSAPGGGGAPTWEDAPSIAVGPITPTGAIVARSIANRFADSINVLDYGADPTGTNDSWLAIQRAIYDGAFAPANRVAASISATETTTAANRTLLRLYNVLQGRYTIRIPEGTYKISKPLVIGMSTHITGATGNTPTRIVMDNVGSGQFTAILDIGWLLATDETATQVWDNFWANYNHGTVIENLGIFTNYTSANNAVAKEYYWIQQPYSAAFNVTSTPYATVSGTAGSNELTSTFAYQYQRAGKIKLYPSGQILDFTHALNNKIYLTAPLASDVVTQRYAFGVPKHNGIWISGGEGSKIKAVWANNMLGAGFFIKDGSPCCIIENTMANFCDIAYRIEDSPAVIIKPSGDCNNVLVAQNGFGNTTVIAGKFEDPRPASNTWPARTDFVPYTNINNIRALFEVEGVPSGDASYFCVNGLTYNGNSASLDASVIDVFAYATSPIIRLEGVRSLGHGVRFGRMMGFDNTVLSVFGRENSFYSPDGYTTYLNNAPRVFTPVELWNGGQANFIISDSAGDPQTTRGGGIAYDLQNQQTKSTSGRMPNRANFSRSGGTATLTYRNAANNADASHGLRVGDQVVLLNYTFTGGTGGLSYNGNTADGTYANVFTVKSTPTPQTLTINVANSGATSGSCNLLSVQYIEFHSIRADEHRIQLPNFIGNPSLNHRAFSVLDRKKSVLASLLVPVEDEPVWWVKNGFAVGGTPSSVSARVFAGADAPTQTAPDGSIYLRTNGTADTTIYVRAAGAWTAIAST